MPGSSFKRLTVWQRSHELAVEIYKLTGCFPRNEQFRLTNQLCRAAASVPTNIAEGEGRFTRPDQIRFLYIARGSLYETQYLLTLSSALGYMDREKAGRVEEQCEEIARMLNGLIRIKRASA